MDYWFLDSEQIIVKANKYIYFELDRACLGLGIEEGVGGIFVAVDLHAVDVTLIRRAHVHLHGYYLKKHCNTCLYIFTAF